MPGWVGCGSHKEKSYNRAILQPQLNDAMIISTEVLISKFFDSVLFEVQRKAIKGQS